MAIYQNYHFVGERHSWRSKTSSKFKKELVQKPTQAEQSLYKVLKPLLKGKSRIQRQKCFFTPKSFILADLYLRAYKVAIEIDGSYHDSAEQQEQDIFKDSVYAYREVKVIRIRNEEVLLNISTAIHKIFDFLDLPRPDHTVRAS